MRGQRILFPFPPITHLSASRGTRCTSPPLPPPVFSRSQPPAVTQFVSERRVAFLGLLPPPPSIELSASRLALPSGSDILRLSRILSCPRPVLYHRPPKEFSFSSPSLPISSSSSPLHPHTRHVAVDLPPSDPPRAPGSLLVLLVHLFGACRSRLDHYSGSLGVGRLGDPRCCSLQQHWRSLSELAVVSRRRAHMGVTRGEPVLLVLVLSPRLTYSPTFETTGPLLHLLLLPRAGDSTAVLAQDVRPEPIHPNPHDGSSRL